VEKYRSVIQSKIYFYFLMENSKAPNHKLQELKTRMVIAVVIAVVVVGHLISSIVTRL
jgi:hypothetical protein